MKIIEFIRYEYQKCKEMWPFFLWVIGYIGLLFSGNFMWIILYLFFSVMIGMLGDEYKAWETRTKEALCA